MPDSPVALDQQASLRVSEIDVHDLIFKVNGELALRPGEVSISRNAPEQILEIALGGGLSTSIDQQGPQDRDSAASSRPLFVVEQPEMPQRGELTQQGVIQSPLDVWMPSPCDV